MPEGRKIGPLSPVGWAAVGGGTFLVYVLYRRHRSAQAGSAQPSTVLLGGNTIPAGAPQSNSGTPSATPQTLQAWEQAALSLMTSNPAGGYSATAAFNDLTQWLSGQPVSAQGYSGIGTAITQLGLPPGISAPPITVASNTPAPTPPALGPQYLGFGSIAAAENAINAGEAVFGQASPGHFEPVTLSGGPGGGVFVWKNTGAQVAPGSTAIYYAAA